MQVMQLNNWTLPMSTISRHCEMLHLQMMVHARVNNHIPVMPGAGEGNIYIYNERSECNLLRVR